jgi:hypothetical protein
MWKFNPSCKCFRMLTALFVCLVAGHHSAFVALSQDRVSRTPMIDLELVKDDGVKPNEPYRVGRQVRVKLIAKNESAERITIADINAYSQNRLELFRNGKLVTYKPQIAKVVATKDAEADMIGVGRQDFIILRPYSSATIRIINLSDWYGRLDPGSYRLTNRFRNEIGGPWSADSKPVVFEVSR